MNTLIQCPECGDTEQQKGVPRCSTCGYSLEYNRTESYEDKRLSINIFLTEKFLGKCWHSGTRYTIDYVYCKKCESAIKSAPLNQDLFSPDGFFLLWEKAQEQLWWDKFWLSINPSLAGKVPPQLQEACRVASAAIPINPLTFPKLLAEYLGWKESTNE